MINRILLFIIAAMAVAGSCKGKKTAGTEAVTPDSLITITAQQYETGKLLLGDPVKMQFEEIIKCSGSVVSDPSGTARISSSVPGLIMKVNCTAGERVNLGQVLFELSGNEFIDLQREFAETASQLIRLSSEYERVKLLYGEHVGTEKELIVAESEFKAANAKYSALRLRLKLIGLDASKIENGDFYESFSIKAPFSGFVSRINVTVGQFADQQTTIAEVIDLMRLQLRLAVFEKDLVKLQKGQKVKFNLLGNTSGMHSAILKSVGKDVDPESKAITCFAEIDDLKNTDFVNNAFVEASVITGTDTVNAVPEEALVKSEGNAFVLELAGNENNTYRFRKVKVVPGRMYKGFTEIESPEQVGKIVIRGAYNIRVE